MLLDWQWGYVLMNPSQNYDKLKCLWRIRWWRWWNARVLTHVQWPLLTCNFILGSYLEFHLKNNCLPLIRSRSHRCMSVEMMRWENTISKNLQTTQPTVRYHQLLPWGARGCLGTAARCPCPALGGELDNISPALQKIKSQKCKYGLYWMCRDFCSLLHHP